ncbi:MAG: GNAT family N-acetyltransferase [Rhodobacteraceae bacterium]|nr:GNAT family N-acetyltransferase [Paracoccaceae bacterium]
MNIREEQAGDAPAIHEITRLAFDGAEHSDGSEPGIVDGLRRAGALTLSLVAETEGQLTGHVAFSPVTIGRVEQGWFGLGPVSVLPAFQAQGIGSALIRDGLERLRASGASGCVVLGEPDYYSRFGFVRDARVTFDGVPPEYFMVLVLQGAAPAGAVTYHPSFYPK